MRIAPVTGNTGDGRDDITLVVFIETKVFLVDSTGHLVHMTGDVFLRLGIAGEIEMMRRAIGRRRMTKITLHTQGRLPAVHDLIQLFVTDIFGQDFQILGPFVRGTGGGHPNDGQCEDANDDGNFLVMQHMEDFDTVN
jgi:hypothetical protein